MARTNTLGNFLTDVADAIRAKKGTQALIPAADFDTEIASIPSGGNLDDYFVSTYNTNTDASNQMLYLKKVPDITIADNVTSLTYAFAGDRQEVVPKIIFNNNVTNIEYMFQSASRLKEVDLSGFNTENVSKMGYMFYMCERLQSVDLSNFDFSKVTNLSYMFGSCLQLTNITFPNSNAPVLINMSGMFNGCTHLGHIDLRNFNLSNITSSNNMFGTSASTGVPNNCEIIVANDTDKTWVTTNFSRLTNVKTVAEYEAQ